MKLLKRVGLFSVFVYGLVTAGLYWFQEDFIFFPMPVAADYQFQFETTTEEVWVNNDDGRLNGVVFKSTAPPRGVVLYFKGNMGNIGYSESIAKIFLALGFDVLSMDYRGSGKSTGPLSEKRLLHDAELWFDWATARYGSEVRVVGYSLGTTFASHLAAVKNVAQTILFAPMRSVVDIARDRFPFVPDFITRYPFRNDQKLKAAAGTVLIYHGTADKVIPFSSGKSLFSVLGADDQFTSVEGANHYTLPYRREVLDHIQNAWRRPI